MEKIKVAQINYRSDIGGGSKNMYILTAKLDPVMFQVVTIIKNEKPYFERFKELNNNTVICCNFKIFQLIKIMLYLKKNRVSILHCHGKGAAIFFRLIKLLMPKIIIVYTFHGIHYKQYSLVKKTIYFAIERLLTLVTNLHICVSNGELVEAKKLKFINHLSTIVIPNGVMCDNTIKDHYNQNGKIKIISIVRLSVQKNVFGMLDAFNVFNNLYPSSEYTILAVENEI